MSIDAWHSSFPDRPLWRRGILPPGTLYKSHLEAHFSIESFALLSVLGSPSPSILSLRLRSSGSYRSSSQERIGVELCHCIRFRPLEYTISVSSLLTSECIFLKDPCTVRVAQ